ncbi:MAG TPA: penicillin acylase family protein, partial [Burkholderiales bacterium]|nr:penicillin acylase family protein [Burkholderiales bacterium]
MQRVLISLISLTLLAVLAAVAGYVYLRQSLPVADGEIVVSGAAGPVEILRDEFGVPHIHASSREDAYFGLGFAHAQDRLWQMEMNRRIGSGRLAEILGPKALETDRFLRTLGIRRVAEANLKHVAPDTLAALEAYAAGVNAFLATDPVLPPEFWIFGVTPEPWTPVDSVAWSKMMAWDLGGNWRAELLRERLSRTLTNERINEFLPPYPGDPAPRLPDLKKLYESLGRIPITTSAVSEAFSSPVAWILEIEPESLSDIDSKVGSNAWAVSGERTVTGKPLLANDPHLGLTAP